MSDRSVSSRLRDAAEIRGDDPPQGDMWETLYVADEVAARRECGRRARRIDRPDEVGRPDDTVSGS